MLLDVVAHIFRALDDTPQSQTGDSPYAFLTGCLTTVFIFVDTEHQDKHLGYAAWRAIEARYPDATHWELVTPYHEKRNIHFYVNRCGFHITEYYNERHPDPHFPQEESGDYPGEDIEVAALHAGLECGTFKVLNPDLDMISIGPDLEDGHTPNETLYLDSIPKIWRLLEGILAKL